MDGMLSDGEMERLTNASGAEFDELFILGMIAHHEGAIEMAQMVVDSKNLEARELAQKLLLPPSVPLLVIYNYRKM